jgi:hypothetical protein
MQCMRCNEIGTFESGFPKFLGAVFSKLRSPLEFDTNNPFSLYVISSQRSSISILRIEAVSDTADGDSGFTGFFFNSSLLYIGERP